MLKPWNQPDEQVSELVGNNDDFEAVMRANGPKIYTLAVRLAGNLSDGQDLAQETFVKAYEHWEKFRGEAEVSTWLYRICVNQWKNRVRYEKRRAFWKHFSLGVRNDDEDAPVREIPSGEPGPDEPLERREQLAALHRALSRLKPDDRAILVLYEMEE